MKRFFILSMLLPLLLISCGKKTDTETEMAVELEGISLSKKNIEMEIGQTTTIIVVYTPEAAAKFAPEVTWESTNPSVASVEKGVVTAKRKGNATISAYCGKFYADCKVEVLTGGDNVIDWNAPYMYLTPTVINDNSYGGEYEVKVMSNQKWSASVSDPWLVVTPSSGENDGTVKITVAEKKTEAEDEGVVTFTAGEITKKVTVKRAKRYLSAPYVSPSQQNVPVEGTTLTVNVNHSSSEWSASCPDKNVTFSDKTATSIKIIIAPNKGVNEDNWLIDSTPSDKTMVVTFKNKEGLSTTLTLIQPNPYASFQLISEGWQAQNGEMVHAGENVKEITPPNGPKYKLHIYTNISWALQFKYNYDSKYDFSDYVEASPSSGTGDRVVSLTLKSVNGGNTGKNKGELYFNGTGTWSEVHKWLCYTYTWYYTWGN